MILYRVLWLLGPPQRSLRCIILRFHDQGFKHIINSVPCKGATLAFYLLHHPLHLDQVCFCIPTQDSCVSNVLPLGCPQCLHQPLHLLLCSGRISVSDGVWVVRCPWVNSPYYKVDHFLGGGPGEELKLSNLYIFKIFQINQ